jgi:hypothetical protein
MRPRILAIACCSCAFGGFGCADLVGSSDEAAAQLEMLEADGAVTLSVSNHPTPVPPKRPTFGQCGLWPGQPIVDFEDGDSYFGNRSLGSCFLFNDGTGTQEPASSDELVVAGGPRPSKYMMASSGIGFDIWGAGLGCSLGCVYDVSRFRGVRFQVAAEGARSFYLQVATQQTTPIEAGGSCIGNCYDNYRYPIFLADASWYECTVRFDDLDQAGWGTPVAFDPHAILTVQFNVETWQLPYDLKLDGLQFAANPNQKTGCLPIAPPDPLFSFESGVDWSNVNEPAILEQSPMHATHGRYSLKVSDNPGGWFGAHFPIPRDFTGQSAVAWDVYAEKGTPQQLAIQTGSGWDWCEAGGWAWIEGRTTISVALSGLSCSSGNPPDLSSVRGLYVFVGGDGPVYLDNVRLVTEP